jgi:hypothetical protein
LNRRKRSATVQSSYATDLRASLEVDMDRSLSKARSTFVSLLASARLHKLGPLAYLRDLFCLILSWPKRRILELAPVYWKTRERPETQQKLDANVFRRVLPLHPARPRAIRARLAQSRAISEPTHPPASEVRRPAGRFG